MGFLRQVVGKKTRRIEDGSWRKASADGVLQAAGTKPLKTYIDKSQETLAEWVALRPIFGVFSKDMVYKRGGGVLGAVVESGGS